LKTFLWIKITDKEIVCINVQQVAVVVTLLNSSLQILHTTSTGSFAVLFYRNTMVISTVKFEYCTSYIAKNYFNAFSAAPVPFQIVQAQALHIYGLIVPLMLKNLLYDLQLHLLCRLLFCLLVNLQ